MRALVIDNGAYTGFAERLVRDGFKVGYFSSWTNSDPLTRQFYLGTGLDGIERVNDPIRWLDNNNPDLICIPDLWHNDFEYLARESGIPTFGSGDGNLIETDRWALKELLDKNDLPVVESFQIEGIEALGKFLQNPKNDDMWIKANAIRGDMNTFCHRDWSETEFWFADLLRRVGPLGEQIVFIAERPIDNAIEVTIEGWWVGDTMLMPCVVGFEIKDSGEFGFVCESLNQLPRSVRDILTVLAKYWDKYAYRNFFAIEIRILQDGSAYLTDVAARIPLPPGGVLMGAVQNFGEVIFSAAKAIPIAPNFGKTTFLSDIRLKSDWIVDDFLRVRFPEKIHDRINLENHCKVGGEYWIVPHVPTDPEMNSFGSCFDFGPTMEGVATGCEKIAEQIKALRLFYDASVLDKAKEEIAKGKKAGIKPPE